MKNKNFDEKTRRKTDKALSNMEKRLSDIYADASEEISESWATFMRTMDARVDAQRKVLEFAVSSGAPQDEVDKLTKEYQRLIQNETLGSVRYKQMLDDVTNRMANVNQIATDYINGEMPSIYALNYNSIGKRVPVIENFTYPVISDNAVNDLALNGKIRMPKKVLDPVKDKKWNTKLLNSQVMQGIIQGEPIPRIAERLQNVILMNESQAIRSARTICTSVENKAKLDGYKKLEEGGVELVKVWMATFDHKTRLSHLQADGEERKDGEKFSNGLMYPGDPNGAPEEVYNCRCALTERIISINGVPFVEDERERIIKRYNGQDDERGHNEVVKEAEAKRYKQSLIRRLKK